MKIYISGQMTGLPKLNKERFDEIEMILTSKGYDVVNPHKIIFEDGKEHSYMDYIRKDICELIYCDRIFMMTGWENSKGAKIEHSIAIILGIKVIYE